MRTLALLLLALLSCADDRVQKYEEPPPPEPRCGDGARNGDEQCEGADLGDATCQSLGYLGGTLGCQPTCAFDTSHCTRTCGNGKVDFTEECDGAKFRDDEVCHEWGVLRCTPDCRTQRTGCVTTPFVELQRVTATAWVSAVYAGAGPFKPTTAQKSALYVTFPGKPEVDVEPFDATRNFTVRDPAGRNFSLELGTEPYPTDVLDLNADGTADVYVRNKGGAKAVTLRLSAVSGGALASFATATVALGCEPGQPLFADLDGDGDLDVVQPQCTADGATAAKVQVLRADSPGYTLVPLGAAQALPEATKGFALADVTKDGKLDLVVQVPGTQSLAVFAGTGLGFAATSTSLAAGEVPGDFALLDFDSDGDVDVAAVNDAKTALRLLKNQGDGTVVADVIASNLTGARWPRVADLDQDGLADVALLTATDLLVLQNAQGDFTLRKATLPLNMTPLTFTLADVDGDTDLDAVLGGTSAGSARGEALVFRNAVR